MPDVTLKSTVDGIVELLLHASNPLSEAKKLFDALQTTKTEKDLEELRENKSFEWAKKWIPDSPEKIAAYIAILYTIVQLWTKEPNMNIDYNKVINNYQQSVQIIIENEKSNK